MSKPIRIIFVDEYNSSLYNGIGNFRDIIVATFGKIMDYEIFILSLNSPNLKIKLIKHKCHVELMIPSINNGDWRNAGDIICRVLGFYLKDSDKTIFMLNHSPCSKFICDVKEVFRKSKFIFVIHDQGWCAPLLGNHNVFKSIIAQDRITCVSRDIYDFVYHYYEEEKQIYNIVDAVVCLSDATNSYLRLDYDVSDTKIYKIYNGYIDSFMGNLSKKDSRKYLGLNEDEKIILFVGRGVEHKGIRNLLLAIRRIKNIYPETKCVLIGCVDNFYEYWDIAKDIASKLIMPCFLTKQELAYWYSAADFGIIPSYTEQCSFVALEMMGSELITISTDGNGLKEMFRNGENAIVANLKDNISGKSDDVMIAEAMSRAFELNDKERERIIQSNKNLINGKYSINNMKSKYNQLFHSLISC